MKSEFFFFNIQSVTIKFFKKDCFSLILWKGGIGACIDVASFWIWQNCWILQSTFFLRYLHFWTSESLSGLGILLESSNQHGYSEAQLGDICHTPHCYHPPCSHPHVLMCRGGRAGYPAWRDSNDSSDSQDPPQVETVMTAMTAVTARTRHR